MRIIRGKAADGSIVHAAVSGAVVHAIEGDLFGSYRVTDREVAVEQLLAPYAPTQIIGIGLNYRHHAAESGMAVPEYPVVFHKTLNAVLGPDAPIVLPRHVACEKTDYECELGVVIARDCKDVAVEDALDVVFGYTCANDVSARDWQIDKGGGQWSRGKSFDTFCPIGPVLVTRDEIPNPNGLRISTTLNGQLVQDWRTDDMIFSVAELIAFLSAGTTLKAGTLILTGTPHGVGMAAKPPRWLRAGDVVVVTIPEIGALRNAVEQEA
jgi:2-keto-4-pentenoate hydratase/2-oxohepta-3-ene-1,7-dioic acid hydratase in catechol pathway